ncbi:Cna B-type domain-containing protein [Tannockella kyphosi]|uniref:Cna B-type domain-containing protein n=1 Tax=Tannockella kyphosi TaxID=2899121 RepID=UPI0020114DB0|nr:Cna B-type domain-containing protein [Tannockella kyphosi]
MMKYLRKAFVAVACLLVCLISVVNVEAMGLIDTSAQGSITIKYSYDDIELSGITCKVTQVATISSYGEYSATEKFDGLPMADDYSSNEEWSDYKDTLGVLMNANLIESDYTVVTNEYGYVTLSGLATGLYIIEFEDLTILSEDGLVETTYSSDTVLVSVPTYDVVTGEYSYEQTTAPKVVMTENEVEVYEEPELISVSVNKIWENDNLFNIRPTTVEVTLYCDGQVYDVINLTIEDAWTYTWEDLDPECVWAVLETSVHVGYEVGYEVVGNIHIIKNSFKYDDVLSYEEDFPIIDDVLSFEEEIPQTGVVLWPMQALAAVGVFLISAGLIIEKRGNHEKKR